MEEIEYDGTIYENTEIGKLNYLVYRCMVGGKSMEGKPLMEFHDMPLKIQKAWTKSAEVVYNWSKFDKLPHMQEKLLEKWNSIKMEQMKAV